MSNNYSWLHLTCQGCKIVKEVRHIEAGLYFCQDCINKAICEVQKKRWELERKVADEEFRQRKCPQCRSKLLETTLKGYFGVDYNRATCRGIKEETDTEGCGWTGLAYECEPTGKERAERDLKGLGVKDICPSE